MKSVKHLCMAATAMITVSLACPAVCHAIQPSDRPFASESLAAQLIKGQVRDASDGSPVAFADVIVTDIKDKVLAHTTSSENGSFSIEGIKAAKVIVMVKMMGYEAFVSEPLDTAGETDLGTIELKPSGEGLQEVTVVGEKSQIVYKLDRQTISATASAVASGGTAIDILATAPSVLVDSDGNVTFRGSGNYLVYVDGRLSPLDGAAALRSIPSANVEDIEIITTPSARYRTDGDGPIINITTKKNTSAGLSGIINLSGSTIGTWGADGTLNWRKGRNNFYIGGTYQHIKGKSDFHQEKTTDVSGVKTTSISDGTRWSDYATKIGRAGWQYSDGRKHNLNVEFQAGATDNWRGGDMLYDETRTVLDMTGTNAVYNAHDRYELLKHLFQASVDYVWRPTAKSEFAVSSRMRHDWNCLEYTESNLFTTQGIRYEGTRGYEEEHHWDADGSLSYKYNYSDKGNVEFGYQYTTYSEHGGYRITYWDREAQAFEWQEDLATPFYYRRQVNSVYGMLTQKAGNFSFDAGLRADAVHDQMDIEIKDASRDIHRFNLFPSAHVSYDARKGGIITAGYSYRTNRPGIWNLEPYITYEDYYTKKIGNPDIRPEYIHSGELGWHRTFESGTSLAATGYIRHRKDISEWIRRAYEPGVTLDMIVNAGDQLETGVEANAVFKPVKWWQTTIGGCLFDYKFTAKDVDCTDREGLHWFANWANAFNAGKTTRLQFDGHVIGPKILSQGSEKAYFFFNAAVRQNLFKDKMTVALVGHDIFRTAKYVNRRTAIGLNSDTTVRPVYPNIILSLTYNFNSSSHKTKSNTDIELFEGKNF